MLCLVSGSKIISYKKHNKDSAKKTLCNTKVNFFFDIYFLQLKRQNKMWLRDCLPVDHDSDSRNYSPCKIRDSSENIPEVSLEINKSLNRSVGHGIYQYIGLHGF